MSSRCFTLCTEKGFVLYMVFEVFYFVYWERLRSLYGLRGVYFVYWERLCALYGLRGVYFVYWERLCALYGLRGVYFVYWERLCVLYGLRGVLLCVLWNASFFIWSSRRFTLCTEKGFVLYMIFEVFTLCTEKGFVLYMVFGVFTLCTEKGFVFYMVFEVFYFVYCEMLRSLYGLRGVLLCVLRKASFFIWSSRCLLCVLRKASFFICVCLLTSKLPHQ